MGNPVRIQEEAESKPLSETKSADNIPDSLGYYIPGSLDPFKWVKYYRSFQRHAFEWSRQSNLQSFIEFDIANFYDSINLDILERKIRTAVPPEKNDIVNLLFVFLRNWNREHEGYGSKSVGLPQDDIGDCSRMLANFYLLDYDEFMFSNCQKVRGKGRYLRYSDDQIIMAESSSDTQRILFDASIELHKIGLNIHSGKVHDFLDKDDYDFYWAFEFFNLLGDVNNTSNIDLAAQLFIVQLENDEAFLGRPWRSESVLKRLINVGFDKINRKTRQRLLGRITADRLIRRLNANELERLYLSIDHQEREELINAIERGIARAYHNSFLLNVLRFYTRCRKESPTAHIYEKLGVTP